MPTPTYTVTCTRNRPIARDIWEFAFTKPAGFTFKPGQFVLFDVPLLDNPADVQTRAMSIGTAPGEDELVFVAKMMPGGRISRYIEVALLPGGTMTMKGPFGLFVLDPTTTKEYLFISTSTGVAPFRSQMIATLADGDRRRMDLIFGVRSEEDLFWREELESLAQKHENVHLHIALSAPSDAWHGHRGRVQTLVPLIVPDFSKKVIYACGSPEMTKDIKKLAMEEWRVMKEDLHVEGYI